MVQLCTLFAMRHWPKGLIRDRIFAWPGDITPAGASVPLRLAGALHALHIMGHARLAPVYPPQTATDDALWDAVCDVLTREAAHIDTWLNSAPQTNEVRRSAVLIATGHLLQNRYAMPIDMVELGASAGLNLMWDRFALKAQGQTFGPPNTPLTLAPEWKGDLPFKATPTITSRRGVDLNPLDPQVDSLRLRAYLWADQPHRRTLTDAAIAIHKAHVDKGDAIDWLAQNLTAKPGHVRLIYHTVAWQYFPDDVQTAGTALITAAGAQATDDTPLAWFGMENDGTGKGAALTLRLWPGDLTFDLGRADFHGRWVTWRNPPDQHED